jgi:tRNA A37 threonylcarbamoyladenosine modification protein TsaB
MPAIDRLFARAGVLQRDSLDLVAVSAGPGGYTSLRVACAVGKMIAAASRGPSGPARCVGVPTAMVVLESVPAEVRASVVAVALASKGDSTWVECFRDGVSAGQGRLVTDADVPGLVGLGVRTLVAGRFLPGAMRASAEAAGLSIIEPVFDAAACARVGARLPSVDPAQLVPIYPREPDAVTLWRAKKTKT